MTLPSLIARCEAATGPTPQQIALARFGDECEASGLKPSHYYRLLPQIDAARAALRARLAMEGGA